MPPRGVGFIGSWALPARPAMASCGWHQAATTCSGKPRGRRATSQWQRWAQANRPVGAAAQQHSRCEAPRSMREGGRETAAAAPTAADAAPPPPPLPHLLPLPHPPLLPPPSNPPLPLLNPPPSPHPRERPLPLITRRKASCYRRRRPLQVQSDSGGRNRTRRTHA